MPVALWENSNRACAFTWFMLAALEELETDFAQSGDLKMSELKFWNKVASAEGRELVAQARAAELDDYYTHKLRAGYEEGHDFGTAVDRMGSSMKTADTTVRMLAAEIDRIYRFRGE